ncbi:craniofacial development protein 2-like [Plakobranchus ocellatus]|uniref:Craniofacial development protein 2-like n=1 Tax=Plakobranchus ocellatus TaxID=259542 RepID=A0AAV4AKU9_9GAST|nr:craniofacial development protein 2-like [Plakobranchus ocellatus]
MGNFNAKVGYERVEDVIGPSGIGNVNERGSRLSEWCQINDLTITNTWYQNHPRRQWTWKSPGDRSRNKKDYILIQKRFRNVVNTSKYLPRADCDSDHIPARTCNSKTGVGGTVACGSALRSAGTLLSRVLAPP